MHCSTRFTFSRFPNFKRTAHRTFIAYRLPNAVAAAASPHSWPLSVLEVTQPQKGIYYSWLQLAN
jgi:hypothetical protein